MHISRKVDVAALCGDALAQLYRGYQRIATRALYRARAELIAQIRREVKETISAEKQSPANGSGAQRPSDALAPSGHRGNRLQAHNRKYDGSEERVADRAQALAAAARKYSPTETLTCMIPLEENVAALHRRLGFETPPSGCNGDQSNSSAVAEVADS